MAYLLINVLENISLRNERKNIYGQTSFSDFATDKNLPYFNVS